MDPLTSKLNKQVFEKIKKSSDFSEAPFKQDNTNFQSTFDDKMATRMLEKLREDSGSSEKTEVTVISADDIKITNANPEFGNISSKPANASDQFFSTFKDLNKDLLSLDSALEALTTPGLKMSPRQLLAMQAGIANTSILAEGFSKFTDAVARGVQTVIQTQVG